ncbi:ATP-binding protein [Tahibacter amnicola]|uniref:histidine kinase n=1 Tax=Tahibacter amnicola TaxID=2976241 RepID=A0ABY6BGF5_9GAMM|nr:ATP-binding protein [Tahibacter amnicola]UXI67450.1 ATP-binding protein [Tahibacter amnicola]
MNAPIPTGPDALARTLAWLRFCAVMGQTVTVFFVEHYLNVALDKFALFGGIGFLLGFGLLVQWRLSRAWPVSAAEVMTQIGVDTAVFAWLLYHTGGASNPFIGLLLMPITLAATTLSMRAVAAVATICVATYIALMHWHLPVPGIHDHQGTAFDLHVLGMATSFGISAVLLAWFIARLARALRERQAETQRIRERALRDEGILAIATQAAGAAHELNTPLSTMRTLLGELQREHPEGPLAQDIALLASQVERCRTSLRDMVAVGKSHLDQRAERVTVARLVGDCRHQFALLRPEIALSVHLPEACAELTLAVPPSLRHAVMNLLNNAAEASLTAGASEVELAVARDGDNLVLRIRDQGPGMVPAAAATMGTRFETSKSTGLGLGLALANATVERLGGELRAVMVPGGGMETCLQLPLKDSA